MSGKRLQTDLGPISLALFDIDSGKIDLLPAANPKDVLRLHGLMNTSNRAAQEDGSHDVLEAEGSLSSSTIEENSGEAFKKLADALFQLHPRIEKNSGSSIAATFVLPFFGNVLIVAQADEEKIAFDLVVSERSACEWLQKELESLTRILRARLGKPVTISIHDGIEPTDLRNFVRIPARDSR